MRALMSKKICVSVRWVKLWVRPPLWKYVCPFVGLPCGCVPPPCENMCVRSLGYIVGASPPCENKGLIHWWSTHGAGHIPDIFSLHAAYSALRHFFNIHTQCNKHNMCNSNVHKKPHVGSYTPYSTEFFLFSPSRQSYGSHPLKEICPSLLVSLQPDKLSKHCSAFFEGHPVWAALP